MTLRRLASIVSRARVPSASSGLEFNSSLVNLTAWSPCAVSSQSRAASIVPSIYNNIHGSGCRCGGCCRSSTYNLVHERFVSGSSSRLAPPEATQAVEKSVDSGGAGAGHVDTSFIHPIEAAQHHAQNQSEDGSYWLMQPVYDAEYLEVVKPRCVFVLVEFVGSSVRRLFGLCFVD